MSHDDGVRLLNHPDDDIGPLYRRMDHEAIDFDCVRRLDRCQLLSGYELKGPKGRLTIAQEQLHGRH